MEIDYQNYLKNSHCFDSITGKMYYKDNHVHYVLIRSEKSYTWEEKLDNLKSKVESIRKIIMQKKIKFLTSKTGKEELTQAQKELTQAQKELDDFISSSHIILPVKSKKSHLQRLLTNTNLLAPKITKVKLDLSKVPKKVLDHYDSFKLHN